MHDDGRGKPCPRLVVALLWTRLQSKSSKAAAAARPLFLADDAWPGGAVVVLRPGPAAARGDGAARLGRGGHRRRERRPGAPGAGRAPVHAGGSAGGDGVAVHAAAHLRRDGAVRAGAARLRGAEPRVGADACLCRERRQRGLPRAPRQRLHHGPQPALRRRHRPRQQAAPARRVRRARGPRRRPYRGRRARGRRAVGLRRAARVRAPAARAPRLGPPRLRLLGAAAPAQAVARARGRVHRRRRRPRGIFDFIFDFIFVFIFDFNGRVVWTRRFRRAASARREKTIRPNVGRSDVDATERAHAGVRPRLTRRWPRRSARSS